MKHSVFAYPNNVVSYTLRTRPYSNAEAEAEAEAEAKAQAKAEAEAETAAEDEAEAEAEQETEAEAEVEGGTLVNLPKNVLGKFRRFCTVISRLSRKKPW